VDNTKAVHKLVKKSLDEEDWATWNFMQWFVKEQVEEETLAMNLLDTMKIAGGEKMSSNAMYTFDRDMENTSDELTAAEDVTSENP
jgi:ferritin